MMLRQGSSGTTSRHREPKYHAQLDVPARWKYERPVVSIAACTSEGLSGDARPVEALTLHQRCKRAACRKIWDVAGLGWR